MDVPVDLEAIRKILSRVEECCIRMINQSSSSDQSKRDNHLLSAANQPPYSISVFQINRLTKCIDPGLDFVSVLQLLYSGQTVKILPAVPPDWKYQIVWGTPATDGVGASNRPSIDDLALDGSSKLPFLCLRMDQWISPIIPMDLLKRSITG